MGIVLCYFMFYLEKLLFYAERTQCADQIVATVAVDLEIDDAL